MLQHVATCHNMVAKHVQHVVPNDVVIYYVVII